MSIVDLYPVMMIHGGGDDYLDNCDDVNGGGSDDADSDNGVGGNNDAVCGFC